MFNEQSKTSKLAVLFLPVLVAMCFFANPAEVKAGGLYCGYYTYEVTESGNYRACVYDDSQWTAYAGTPESCSTTAIETNYFDACSDLAYIVTGYAYRNICVTGGSTCG